MVRFGFAPVQFLWVGRPLGLLEQLSIRSFVAQGHPVHVYMYDASPLPDGAEWKDANVILPRRHVFTHAGGKEAGSYTGFSDLFRYKLLHDKGGWWCDLDMICIKPLPQPARLLIGSERHWLWRPRLCIGAMYAEGGEAGLKAAYEAALTRSSDRLSFGGNGAGLLRRSLHAAGNPYMAAPPDMFNPVGWWQSARIAQSPALTLPAHAHALHCYAESWRWRLKGDYDSFFRNHHFKADTLMGQLQRRYGMTI